jgi:hypothetical protein
MPCSRRSLPIRAAICRIWHERYRGLTKESLYAIICLLVQQTKTRRQTSG